LIERADALLSGVSQRTVELAPQLLGALVLVVLGFISATLIRKISQTLPPRLAKIIPAGRSGRQLQAQRVERFVSIAARILYWLVLFVFLASATEVLGLPVITTWLKGIAGYLPTILVGLLILGAGLAGSVAAREVVTAASASMGIGHSALLGRAVQNAVLLATLLIVLEQLGVSMAFVMNLILLFAGALFLGGALTFSLGAREVVSNILAGYYVQRDYDVGDRLRIGEMEGKVVEITPVAVVLETQAGLARIPSRHFNEKACVRITRRGE